MKLHKLQESLPQSCVAEIVYFYAEGGAIEQLEGGLELFSLVTFGAHVIRYRTADGRA